MTPIGYPTGVMRKKKKLNDFGGFQLPKVRENFFIKKKIVFLYFGVFFLVYMCVFKLVYKVVDK